MPDYGSLRLCLQRHFLHYVFLSNPSQYHQSHEFLLATFDELSTGRPLYINGQPSQPALPNRRAADVYFLPIYCAEQYT